WYPDSAFQEVTAIHGPEGLPRLPTKLHVVLVNIDLLVTVGTAPLHLAGTLAVPSVSAKPGLFHIEKWPDPAFHNFQRKLSAERHKSQYTYGFPNGDGDCNCVTWLERLALPTIREHERIPSHDCF